MATSGNQTEKRPLSSPSKSRHHVEDTKGRPAEVTQPKKAVREHRLSAHSIPSRKSSFYASYYADQQPNRRSLPPLHIASQLSQPGKYSPRGSGHEIPPVPHLSRQGSVDDPYVLGPVPGGSIIGDFSKRYGDAAEPPTVKFGKHGQTKLDDQSWNHSTISKNSTPPTSADRKPEQYAAGGLSSTNGSQPGWWIEICTISYLIFFAIWGTLARLGVQWITFYPGAPIVTPVIWANFGGSFVMGFLSEDKRLFSAYWTGLGMAPEETTSKRWSKQPTDLDRLTKAETAKVKKSIPLYIGLATGFCGSFTSFSSFARDMFTALANDLPSPINHPYASSTAVINSSTVNRNAGYSFNALTAVVITTLALSLGGLVLGAHTALLFESWNRSLSQRLIRRYIDPVIVPLAWLSWLGAILLAVLPPDRFSSIETWRGTVLFAIVFAPPGCLMRYYLSIKLNPLVASFPLGTFAVNMFGTAVEAMCYNFQQVGLGPSGLVGGGLVGCQVLQGMQDGFCGCLTTVSTLVAEIQGLRKRHGYVYALASVLGALGLVLVIMGSVKWTVGWSPAVCDRGYTNKYVN